MSLYSELKRRNVFRVAIAYLVSAWVIAQVASLVLTSFKAPAWAIQALLLLLGIGFLVAVVISWAYELTPEGLKRDNEVSADASIAVHTGKKLNYITIIAALVVLGLFIYQRVGPSTSHKPQASKSANALISPQTASNNAVENSIAVLPFADMSREGDQEYFADGISEEILNVIVRIPNLKVAGRTSSFSFKGKSEDLRLIGESLGVNHILEGSVRRSNTTLRITAQLIRSKDGFHLWSETYDREMADIFDIQDEIAQQVAQQLVISMGLELKTVTENRTVDIVVYEDYLKAKQLFEKRGQDNLDEALKLVNDATARDANYAPAWTLKAHILAVYAAYSQHENQDQALENRRKWDAESKAAANKALALDPNSAGAYATLGNAYFNAFEFIPAFENYNLAIKLGSDNPIILDHMAQNALEVGYFTKAKSLAEKAVNIDPLVAMYRNTLGRANLYLGFEAEAITNFEKSIELNPGLPFPYNNLQTVFFKPENIERFLKTEQRRLSQGFENGLGDEIITVLQSKNAKNKAEIIRIRDEMDEELNKWLLSVYLEDTDQIMKLNELFWSQEQRTTLDHYPAGTILPGMYENLRWKEQLRKDGVLALWRSNGFPAHCRAVGENDFKCDEPIRVQK